jgi:hypothetical protein
MLNLWKGVVIGLLIELVALASAIGVVEWIR